MINHIFGAFSTNTGEVSSVKSACNTYVTKNNFKFFEKDVVNGYLLNIKPDSNSSQNIYEKDSEHLIWSGHLILDDHDFWPNPSKFSETVKNNNKEFSNKLDGIYGIGYYSKDEILYLSTDRYGFFPLYYAYTGDLLLFSTSLDLLINVHPKKLNFNNTSVAEYMHLHHCLNGNTFVKEILRFPVGQTLVYDVEKNVVDFHKYYSYDNTNEFTICNEKDAIDITYDLLLKAIEKRVPTDKKLICLLSGGYDSRALAAGMNKLGREFTAVTIYGDNGWDADLVGSGAVCQALGIPHKIVEQRKDYMESYWEKKCRTIDFCTVMHTWLFPLLEDPILQNSYNYDGLGGDLFIKAKHLNPEYCAAFENYNRKTTVEEVKRINRRCQSGMKIFTKKYCDNYTELLNNSMHKQIFKFSGNKLGGILYLLENRIRMGITSATFCLLDSYCCNLVPFMDYAFVDATLKIDPKLKFNSNLYKKVLEKLNAKLKDIPSTNDEMWFGGLKKVPMPIYSLSNSQALSSMVNRIFKNKHIFSKFIEPKWLAGVKEAVSKDAKVRRVFFRDAHALAELSYWISKYGNKVNISF